MAKYDLTLLEDEPYSDELWSEEADMLVNGHQLMYSGGA